MSQARPNKSEKEAYQQLLGDLEFRGMTPNLFTLEIGPLRYWLQLSQTALLFSLPVLT